MPDENGTTPATTDDVVVIAGAVADDQGVLAEGADRGPGRPRARRRAVRRHDLGSGDLRQPAVRRARRRAPHRRRARRQGRRQRPDPRREDDRSQHPDRAQVGDRRWRRRRGVPASHRSSPAPSTLGVAGRRRGQGAEPRPPARRREGAGRRHHARARPGSSPWSPRPTRRPSRRRCRPPRRSRPCRSTRRPPARSRRPRRKPRPSRRQVADARPAKAGPSNHDRARSFGAGLGCVLAGRVRAAGGPSDARRRQGTTPSISMSSEKLRKVRTSTISPSVAAFSRVWSMATVRMMSAMMRTSSPSRIVRPRLWRRAV